MTILNRDEFENVAEAWRLIAAWKDEFNQHQPHGSLEYTPPAEFAARSAAYAPRRTPVEPPPVAAFQRHCGLTQPELS